MSDLTKLPGLQGFYGNLNFDEKKHFQQHLCQYVAIYMPDCPFEISSTNRYTIGLHEATVIARQPIKKGVAIKYLGGTRVRLTREEDTAETAQPNGDLSIVVQDRNKATSLFLGPARFLNHDCNANAKLLPSGLYAMEVIAVRDIQVGEEITVSYGDDYFDDDKCRCETCNETASLVDQLVCTICRGQFPRDATLECPNCRRHRKIYGHQWPRRCGNPSINPEGPVAVKENHVFQCTDTTAQGQEGDFGLQHNSGNVIDDDYFPTLDELLRSRRDSEPKKPRRVIPKADHLSFQRSSSSINIAQSKLIDLGNSYGK